MVEAYCLKCRQKTEIRDPKQLTLKNGMLATQGVCPICGTKVLRVGKASLFAEEERPSGAQIRNDEEEKWRRLAEAGKDELQKTLEDLHWPWFG